MFPLLLFLATNITADLAFGDAQVMQLMRDRPDMVRLLLKQDDLRNYLVWNFGGLDTAVHVAWEDKEPVSGRSTEYNFTALLDEFGRNFGLVRVTHDLSYPAIDKCVMLVFEMENARSRNRWESLMWMAYKNQISREDYARSCAHLEFETTKRAAQFFRKHPLPPGSESEMLETLESDPADFGELMRTPEYTNYDFFLKQYDKITPSRPKLGIGN